MKSVAVYGRFVSASGKPIEGTIKCIPSKIWVEEGKKTYPTLAPEVETKDGRFNVELSCTTDAKWGDWYYTIETPVGRYKITVPANEETKLADLMDKPAEKD